MSANDLGSLGGFVCVCCEEHPRLRSQRLCQLCHPGVYAAGKHAKRMGGHHDAAFKAIRRTGGHQMLGALDKFEKECMSFGGGIEGPPWDWLSYQQSIVLESTVSSGERWIWMTEGRYLHHAYTQHRTDADVARKTFMELLDSLPSGRV